MCILVINKRNVSFLQSIDAWLFAMVFILLGTHKRDDIKNLFPQVFPVKSSFEATADAEIVIDN